MILFLFLIWSGISWRWYTCGIKGFCGEEKVEAKAAPAKAPPAITYGPLTYNSDEFGALTTDAWADYKQNLLADGKEGQVLVISGPYYNGEAAPPKYADMGLARAASVRDLFSSSLKSERIELASHNLGDKKPNNPRFEGTRFRWVTRNDNVQETMEGALIYFPYKSDERISNPNITAYLDQLAEKLKSDGTTVRIVGHTDSKGSAAYNKQLGMQRSIAIKSVLTSKGVNASKIQAESMGEEQPMESNDTEKGRQKNRRTEIIIKQ